MIDRAFSFIAPHHCCGCGIIGTLLCDNCKYDIIDEPFYGCFVCSNPTSADRTLCGDCIVPYSRAWCAGERSDTLKQLINVFKFSRAKSAYKQLSLLLDETIPQLPTDTVVVPIPTVPAHIRERGYDHMRLIAQDFAKSRKLQSRAHLERNSVTMQRGASRQMRAEQARDAFRCSATLNPDVPYLIVDDVTTTGATLAGKRRRSCNTPSARMRITRPVSYGST